MDTNARRPRSLSRRELLAGAAAAAATGVLASCSPSSGPRVEPAGPTSLPPRAPAPAPTVTTAAAPGPAAVPPPDRVLVIVNLYGGNDGLNTVVPLQGRYHDLRPAIGLADDTLLRFPGTTAFGLHPKLGPLAELAAAGSVAALEAVGFPSPNRSHFAAQDDWASSTPGTALRTGWVGRWLDALGPDGAHPLRAVALSGGAPMLDADGSRPTVVTNPAGFAFRAIGRPAGRDDVVTRWATGGGSGAEATVRNANASALAAVRTFAALQAGTGDDAERDTGGDDPAAGEFTAALETAARVATSTAGVRVVHVAAGGFDTHASQLATQADLLGDLATGIARFQRHVESAGAADRVLLMTVSEFGRRVHDNGYGTDHGKANVHFLVGRAVRAGLYGEADLVHLDDGDLRATTDVRAYYASVLTWLGADVERVLGRTWDDLGLLRP
jgi:uncharacterized protein (DUF1501 family)